MAVSDSIYNLCKHMILVLRQLVACGNTISRPAARTRVWWRWEGWLTADRSPPQAESDNFWQQHRLRGWIGQEGRWWRGGEGEKRGGMAVGGSGWAGTKGDGSDTSIIMISSG